MKGMGIYTSSLWETASAKAQNSAGDSPSIAVMMLMRWRIPGGMGIDPDCVVHTLIIQYLIISLKNLLQCELISTKLLKGKGLG